MLWQTWIWVLVVVVAAPFVIAQLVAVVVTWRRSFVQAGVGHV